MPKIHICMRCHEAFPCPHGDNCTANVWVMPDIVNTDGLGTTEHCPKQPDWEWIRTYGLRRQKDGQDGRRADRDPVVTAGSEPSGAK